MIAIPQRILLGPGPSEVAPRVLEAIGKPCIGHLDPVFLQLMDDIRTKMRQVFRTHNEMTLAVSGTGSAGMETCFVNLVEPGDKVLICVNGVFGQRMMDVASRCGAVVETIEKPFGQVFDQNDVIAAIERVKPKVVAIVHAETSTGASQPVVEIARICHENGALIASNDNWQTTVVGGVIDGDQVAEIQESGLAPTNPAESAIIATLLPGNYTAVVQGKGGATGIGLVETYDLDQSVDSKLANISTRGLVGTGNDVMIGGVIVAGTDPAKVVVRAIGPSLAAAGINDPLADPIIELHDGNGDLVVSNDNWRSDQEADIIATALAPTDDAESAIIATLAPAAYTAIVRGANNTTGVGLVEAYQLE